MPIFYTLHEFLPICHRDGQMVRTKGRASCARTLAAPLQRVLPRHRRRSTSSCGSGSSSRTSTHVDLFLAPSQFLLERYVDWGIPRDASVFEDYGRLPDEHRRLRPRPDRPRNRLGFFGQLNHFKGVDVLLNAMQILRERRSRRAPVAARRQPRRLQPPKCARRFLELARGEQAHNVTFAGPYDHADLPHLMAEIDWVVVPSRWWENSPLVIQEAFMHGRPVICSDIGGMAEKVTDEVNGLHFNVGSPAALAETIRAASTTSGLWDRLQAGIPGIFTMSDHVANLTRIYDELADRHRPPQPPVPTLAPVET